MNRIPFSQVLNNTKVDLRREYDRLYGFFFLQNLSSDKDKKNKKTLRDYIADCFINMPIRGTCVSLDDFDDFYGYCFEKDPLNVNEDYLVTLCEYSYNLVINAKSTNNLGFGFLDAFSWSSPIQFYLQQVLKVIDAIGYMGNTKGCVTDFVPKDNAAISVSEIVEPELSYKVLEYNHRSMKGDLSRKRDTLLALADKLEPQQRKLNQINATFSSDLFWLFNNINIRHNNSDPLGKNYHLFVAEMSNEELEQWYDEVYQMCLLAFLRLEHTERKTKINQLKDDINNKKADEKSEDE